MPTLLYWQLISGISLFWNMSVAYKLTCMCAYIERRVAQSRAVIFCNNKIVPGLPVWDWLLRTFLGTQQDRCVQTGQPKIYTFISDMLIINIIKGSVKDQIHLYHFLVSYVTHFLRTEVKISRVRKNILPFRLGVGKWVPFFFWRGVVVS